MKTTHQGSMAKATSQYQIAFGSDVDRDGVYVELARIEPDGNCPVLEVFRSDRDGSITITAETEPLPPELIARLIEQIKADLLERPR